MDAAYRVMKILNDNLAAARKERDTRTRKLAAEIAIEQAARRVRKTQ